MLKNRFEINRSKMMAKMVRKGGRSRDFRRNFLVVWRVGLEPVDSGVQRLGWELLIKLTRSGADKRLPVRCVYRRDCFPICSCYSYRKRYELYHSDAYTCSGNGLSNSDLTLHYKLDVSVNERLTLHKPEWFF